MPVNLLTQRLKAAKRELTNLKTAHKRGLGLLKIYTESLTITDAPESGIHELDLYITLDRNFAAYPYVQVFPAVNNNFDYSLEVDGFTYSDGYNVRYHLLYAFGDPSMNWVQVVSSSPIIDITHNWTS